MSSSSKHTRSDFVKVTTVAPVHAARLCIYQPSRRPVTIPPGGEWIDTNWGKVRVSGRLGQRHADAVDACIATALELEREPNGRIRLLVDLYAVRRVLSRGEKYSGEGVKKLLKEVSAALVEWEKVKNIDEGVGHIVDEAEASGRKVPHPLGGERYLWRVVLGAKWSKEMIDKDIKCRYDVASVAGLRYGVSEAFARICLSHDSRKWPAAGLYVDTVLDWLQIVEKQARADARYRISKDAAALAKCGLTVEKGRVIAQPPRPIAQPPRPIAQPPG